MPAKIKQNPKIDLRGMLQQNLLVSVHLDVAVAVAGSIAVVLVVVVVSFTKGACSSDCGYCISCSGISSGCSIKGGCS